MASNAAIEPRPAGALATPLARAAEHGSARHPHLAALLASTGPAASRDLADAVHLLCVLHGRHPGLADVALHSCPAGTARDWLRDTADAFDRERLYLVRLTAAVGPTPSTPGSAETEAAMLAQRHALETLARSERSGCALGAAAALVEDWHAIRALLDKAAERSNIPCPPVNLPSDDSIAAALVAGATGPAAERASRFGAEQMLLQHRALFDLLEARAAARGDF